MDLRAAFVDLKNRAMAAVEQAAKERDTARIVALSDLLAEIERDEKVTVALEDRARSHEARLKSPGEMVRAPQPLRPAGPTSAKQRARAIREAFTRRHSLTPEKGQIYRTQSGSRVGVAVTAVWFLGLPDTQLDCVVLLCHTDNGEVLDFVLPMTAMSDVWPRLSRSGDQVKFNVKRRNGTYQLQVPGAGPLDIRPFLGGYGPLA